ncbi:hypothetical protein [Xanthovirga aplysinae]|uniref:hypothetical protein n=1 Tax=Xanthovirga aplysinae TaxID=2529853 RepID=UPI0012BD629C|nr:hypothetical protein [Xanthovirga aplysinae]MTI32936.1 hypothetical protein [Xanthovirga aplysinae]
MVTVFFVSLEEAFFNKADDLGLRRFVFYAFFDGLLVVGLVVGSWEPAFGEVFIVVVLLRDFLF